MKSTTLSMAVSAALPAVISIVLLNPSTAHAANSANLKVTGMIRPSACALTVAAGGTVDYGTIARTELSAGAPTALPEKSIAFVINCASSASKTAIKLTDNRADSAVSGVIQSVDSSLSDRAAFGLGTVNSKKLGAYSVQIYAVSGDSVPTTPYHRADSSASWLKNAQIGDHYFSGDQKSWGVNDVSGPSAFKKISGYLNIRAVIDKSGNLPAGEEIQLNGSSTLEFIYL